MSKSSDSYLKNTLNELIKVRPSSQGFIKAAEFEGIVGKATLDADAGSKAVKVREQQKNSGPRGL